MDHMLEILYIDIQQRDIHLSAYQPLTHDY